MHHRLFCVFFNFFFPTSCNFNVAQSWPTRWRTCWRKRRRKRNKRSPMPSQSPRHTCPLVTTTHRMGTALTNQRQRIPLPIKRSLTGLQNTCLQTAPPGTVHNAAARDDVGNVLLLLLLTLHQPTRFSRHHGRGRAGGGSNRGGRRP